METERIGKGSAEERSKERGGMVGRTWEDINDESFRLSHLVQSGRRVSKDQLLEVNREVKGPHGFFAR